jgi:hypothetical protein
MKDGNNGGYANNWLVADRKSNEIASLELGLKNVVLQRTRDGFFVGSNFPNDPQADQGRNHFDVNDKSKSENARHARWLTLMEQNKGQDRRGRRQRFLADHFDSFEGKIDPSERTLCGHVDLSPRGMPTWQAPYAPGGRGAEQGRRRRRRRYQRYVADDGANALGHRLRAALFTIWPKPGSRSISPRRT